jgi:hypothetical protein
VLKLIRNAKQKYIEDHPYSLHSKPITDEDMLENQNPFMTLWKTDALFEDSLTGLFRASNRNLIKQLQRPLQGTSNPGHFVLYQIQRLKQIRVAGKKKSSKVMNPMSSDWLEDLKPLRTDWHKAFLETAPYLIIVLDASMNLTQKKRKTIITFRKV